jgi:hypothetical protein
MREPATAASFVPLGFLGHRRGQRLLQRGRNIAGQLLHQWRDFR